MLREFRSKFCVSWVTVREEKYKESGDTSVTTGYVVCVAKVTP